jgi:hypothetical protein
MSAHLVGFGITAVGTLLLGPLGLIIGIIAWVLMAKK